jgi:diguanylate cyclase (GGDEF)-like protein
VDRWNVQSLLSLAEERRIERERLNEGLPTRADDRPVIRARASRITRGLGEALRPLVNMTEELQLPQTLEEMMQRVVDRAGGLLGTGYASLRLVDASRTRLLTGCRSGSPQHRDGAFEFKVGEGLVGWVAQHRQPARVGDVEGDPRYLARPDLKVPFRSFLGVPLIHEGQCLGVLAAVHPDVDRFSADDEQILQLLGGMCAPHLEIARLARLARVDPLTGSLNREGLDDAFSECPPTHAGAAAGPVSVLVVDIDSFTALNQRFGHDVGDAVLRSVGQILAASLRVGDAVVRYGGDEFLLVIPGVALTSASRVAERARKAIERTTIEAEGFLVQTSVTIGVAERLGNEPRELLVKRAEAALRAGQQRGYNLVQIATS